MRKTHINGLLLILVMLAFVTCAKETDDKLDVLEKFYYDNPESIAQVKFVYAYTPLTINGTAAASVSGTTTSGTGFRITMDGKKLNGPASAGVASAANVNAFFWGPLPGGTNYFASFFPATTTYAFLPPGPHTFKFTLNRIVGGVYAPIAGDEVFSTTVALAPGKKYSMFLADPYGPPGAYMIEDVFTVPPSNQFAARFINLTADATRYDVISTKLGVKLFSNVGFKEMKDFAVFPTTVSDTIYLRNAATNAVIAQINGFSPATQRVYTFYARGKAGVTGRTAGINYYTNR
jgi:hypothetical protein